jgi:hypothetical protein
VASIPIRISSTRSSVWRAAQLVAVGLTGILVIALFVWPDETAYFLWQMVIPLLPAVFLVNPMLWRNICPLASLNTLAGSRARARPLAGRQSQTAWSLGIVLLAILVPARRFLFNTSGPALAVTIMAVGVMAVVAGMLFARRAGFCNAICPVLPVEKLYGQAPLVRVSSARCGDCSVCTPVGCIDLAAGKTVNQTLGPARRTAGWVRTPFGAFAAAFPGFIVGYFTVDDGGLSTAATVYTHIALFAFASFAIVALTAAATKVSSRHWLRLLGGAAFLLYYWYAAPGLAEAYHAGASGPLLIRSGAVLLLAVWVWKGARQTILVR